MIREEYTNQEEILEDLSRKLKLPRDKLEFIVKELWKSVRYYITNPTEAKSGTLLNEFANFYINPHSVKRKLKTVLDKGIKPKKIELYEQLIKHLHEDTGD